MKALILAAGRGTRLGTVSEARNKCLVTLGGRPVIEYSLDNALLGGATSAVVVVGYRGDEVIDAVGDAHGSLSISYVRQPKPSGVVDAMECARRALDGEDFLLFFADEVLRGPRHNALVERFRAESLFVMIGIVPERDPAEIAKTYEVRLDATTERVTKLVEKPDRPAPGFRGTGNCVFRNGILEYVHRTPVNSRRGEREFPDLIQCAIDDGQVVKADIVASEYVNVNTAQDLAAAEQRFGVPRG